MQLISFRLFSLLLCSFVHIHPNILLQAPKCISTTQVDALSQDWSTVFTWSSSYKVAITFGYGQRQAGFAMQWLAIPWYCYNYKPILHAACLKFKNSKVRSNYYFDQPLLYKQEQVNPQNINFEQLVSLLGNKKFIFYTGAGISAGTVATMYELEKSLYMNNGIQQFLKQAWKHSDKIAQAFSDFCHSAAYGLPTPAHEALKQIAHHKSIAILTENVDLLQQRTGIEPLFTGMRDLDDVTASNLQEIDMVVCVGLSHDDRGFLAHFKKHHPQGLLVAIDLKQPNYLSDQDYLVQGDLQEILSKLALSLVQDYN